MSIFNVGLSKTPTKKSYKPNRNWITHKIISGLSIAGQDAGQPHRGYRASEFSVCPRKSVLRGDIPIDGAASASSLMYTTIGDTVHELLQTALFKADVLLWKEYYSEIVHNDIKFSGSCDAIVIDKMMEDIGIVDIKTTGDIPAKPKIAYQKQIGFYGLLLGIPHMSITYASRNVGMPEPKIKTYAVNPEIITKVALDFGTALALKPGELFPRLRNKQSCAFCPYQQRCWEPNLLLNLYSYDDISDDTKELAREYADRLIDSMSIRRGQVVEHIIANGTNTSWLKENKAIVLTKYRLSYI